MTERMNVYVGHPKSIDYLQKLYPAIKKTRLYKEHHVVLPHEYSGSPFHSKEYLPTCSLMIAEGSEQATGLGIEMGWADLMGIPILCIYQEGRKIAGSYKVMTNQFICYADEDDLVEKLDIYIGNIGGIQDAK